MPGKKYVVRLSDDERAGLETMVKSGKGAAYQRLHAQMLLLADVGVGGPGWKDEPISQACQVRVRTWSGCGNGWSNKGWRRG